MVKLIHYKPVSTAQLARATLQNLKESTLMATPVISLLQAREVGKVRNFLQLSTLDGNLKARNMAASRASHKECFSAVISRDLTGKNQHVKDSNSHQMRSGEDSKSDDLNALLYCLMQVEEFRHFPVSYQNVILSQIENRIKAENNLRKSDSANKASRDETRTGESTSNSTVRSSRRSYGELKSNKEYHCNAFLKYFAGATLFAMKAEADQQKLLSRAETGARPSDVNVNSFDHVKREAQDRLEKQQKISAVLNPCRRDIHLENEVVRSSSATLSEGNAEHRLLAKMVQQQNRFSNDVLGFGCGPIRFQQSMPTGPPSDGARNSGKTHEKT